MRALRRRLAQLTFALIGVGMLSGYAQADSLVLISDPRVLSVRILDNREPMINLKDQKEIAFGPSPEIPNNQDYTFIRKSVYEKLKQAQASSPKFAFLFIRRLQKPFTAKIPF